MVKVTRVKQIHRDNQTYRFENLQYSRYLTIFHLFVFYINLTWPILNAFISEL